MKIFVSIFRLHWMKGLADKDMQHQRVIKTNLVYPLQGNDSR
jgi:hypothetical protein